MTTEQKQPVQVYMETNPNPNSLKFVTNLMLAPEGESFDFPKAESAVETSPLAESLFGLGYVKGVFISSDFVTVTKADDKEWIEIQHEIRELVKKHLSEGKPTLSKEAVAEKASEGDSAIVIRIKSLLDEYVRPGVEQDGGAIVFDSFEDGVVKVRLQGSCSGCPSSTITLKSGIENLLTHMIPEVTSVEAVND
ncbi:iron transporter [Fulvitalea axinellae]|uniref:Iron transporter n=1 Tax=Fulvitalea axinellae TaxID=1182444 RepID=A0AAU9CJN7_9BACT|nr:iron transporter [Fulvitalea axinellae]